MAKKVLVGESNYAEFEILNDFLTAKGFGVTWFKNGRDVVDQFAEISPDLMILDALMPGMTGLKITQAVRAAPGAASGAVKIILMSSVYKEFKEQYEARKHVGVDAYTEKPVNVEELDRLVSELVGDGRTPEEEEEAFSEIPRVPDSEAEDAQVVPDKKVKIGIDGDVSETPFPKLLFYLHKYQRTGALRVDLEQINKVIYFQSGFPVLVTSNQSTESLGRFLVQKKLITLAQYNASLEKMLETGRQHGEVLLEMGAISPHNLFRGLYDHIIEKVLSIFSWERGRYRFRAGRFAINQSFTINIDPILLIRQGVKRFYKLERLEDFFNEYKNKRLIRTPDPSVAMHAIGFGPPEMKFTTLINDRRSVGQIVARSHLPLTETFQVLFILLVLETIRFKGDTFFGEKAVRTRTGPSQPFRERRREFKVSGEEQARIRLERELFEFKKQVDAAHQRYGLMNHYQLLSLPRNANINQVKASYFVLSSRFHDHNLYSKSDDETKEKADELFQALSEAYAVLIQPSARRKYDHDLAVRAIEEISVEAPGAVSIPLETPEPPPVPRAYEAPEAPVAASVQPLFEEAFEAAPPPPEKAPGGADELSDLEMLWDADEGLAESKEEDHLDLSFDDEPSEAGLRAGEVTSGMASLMKAELAFQEGEDALRKDEFEKAAAAFQKALRSSPNEAEYYAYLGWAVFQTDPLSTDAVDRARESIAKGISINPTMDTGHYFLGMIAFRLGEWLDAKGHLEKALECNPDNQAAAEAMRKLEEG